MSQSMTVALTKKNYNAAVSDYDIDLKKIIMPQLMSQNYNLCHDINVKSP